MWLGTTVLVYKSILLCILLSKTVVNFEYTTSLHQSFSLYCNYTTSKLIRIVIVY